MLLSSTPRTMPLFAAIVCVVLLYVTTLAFMVDLSLNHFPCLVPADAECWAARLASSSSTEAVESWGLTVHGA